MIAIADIDETLPSDELFASLKAIGCISHQAFAVDGTPAPYIALIVPDGVSLADLQRVPGILRARLAQTQDPSMYE